MSRGHEEGLSPLYLKLAEKAGVPETYLDAWKNPRTVPEASRVAVLRAMGYDDPGRALRELEGRPWNRLLPPVMVISTDDLPHATVPVHFPLEGGKEADASLKYTLTDETGASFVNVVEDISIAEEHDLDGVRHVRADIRPDASLVPGYYRLDVRVSAPGLETEGTMRLIITPPQCFTPERPAWGVTLSLYSLRSERNWGIGDLGDLRRFIRWAAERLGAGFVGISPLHAIPNEGMAGISPYFPISRLYRNYIYLDLNPVLEESSGGREFLSSEETRAECARLRDTELVDYEGVAALKLRALRVAYDGFQLNQLAPGSPEAEEFRAYAKRQGLSLDNFATFMALAETRGYDSRAPEWSEYASPESGALAQFRQEHQDEILFHKYVQWLIDRQMAEAASAAEGMSVGLYTDLAVGSAPGGSDAWSHPDVFPREADTGAPPDAFNTSGQNWSFPPPAPEELRRTGYEIFVQTIRQSLRHAGALRIDHALGLFRLYWIPRGMPAAEGAYVRYPHEDLMGIVTLESARNRTAVVAEDLGTVGAEVREMLHDAGMLSYRLLYFERHLESMTYHPPGEYPEFALAAVTTHDLPTLRGYWEGHDIGIKAALGFFGSEEEIQQARDTRRSTVGHIVEALRRELPDDIPDGDHPPMDRGLLLAVHRFLARTRARLVSVSLDDALEMLEQQNLPGVTDGHPNWQRKYPLTVEELAANEVLASLAAMFREEGRSA